MTGTLGQASGSTIIVAFREWMTGQNHLAPLQVPLLVGVTDQGLDSFEPCDYYFEMEINGNAFNICGEL